MLFCNIVKNVQPELGIPDFSHQNDIGMMEAMPLYNSATFIIA